MTYIGVYVGKKSVRNITLGPYQQDVTSCVERSVCK